MADQKDPNSLPAEEEKAEEEEFKCFNRTIYSYQTYSNSALAMIKQKRKYFADLSEQDQKLVSGFNARLDKMENAIQKNAAFLSKVTGPHKIFINSDIGKRDDMQIETTYVTLASQNESDKEKEKEKETERKKEMKNDAKSDITQSDEEKKSVPPFAIKEADYEKVRSVLKQIVRDWGELGRNEREASFDPIIDALDRLYGCQLSENEKGEKEAKSEIKVLVPGAGLGRLAWEIAKRGFSSQGNEFSYYCLIMSNFILNHSSREKFEIYPYVHETCNAKDSCKLLQKAIIPEVSPGDLPQKADFSMCAGDFLEAYDENGHKNAWDCVVSCFFIDTAHNIVAYAKKIYSILKQGGYWINNGPLLYHYADIYSESSIELTLEEVFKMAENIGFKITEKKFIESVYTSNPESMMKTVYTCSYFVAKKQESEFQIPTSASTGHKNDHMGISDADSAMISVPGSNDQLNPNMNGEAE